MTPKQTWRDILAIHPAAEDYPMMSKAEIAELAADIKAHGLDQRVLRWRDGSILDGRNRLDALELNGVALFDAAGEPNPAYFAFDPGVPGVTAKSRVASLNLHRRHLTAEQQRIIVAKLLHEHPEKSNRAIAKEAKVSDMKVGRVRTKMETEGTIAPQETVAGNKPGVKQPRKKAKKTPTVVEAPPKQKPGKQESKSAEWGRLCDEGVASLERMEEMRQEWSDTYDNLNEGLQQTPYGLNLEAMQSLDLESALSAVQEAGGLNVPLGFGRD